jgi:8-oxo-dGTP pyrophosphatase MutT (NUDIX family)
MSTPLREVRSCGVLIVRGDPIREVLLMEHPTRLDIPKGHVEPGESDEQCALRELWEETGITADDIDLDPAFRFVVQYNCRYRKSDELLAKTVIVLLGRLKHDVTIHTSEHQGFRWLAWNPPHTLQPETIDPLLAYLAVHLETNVAGEVKTESSTKLT